MQHFLARIKRERQDIISVLSTTALSTAISFFTLIAFSNLVSTNTLGTYHYIIALTSIIGTFSLTGINVSVIRAIGKKEFFIVQHAKKILITGSIPALLIASIIASYYLMEKDWQLGFSILICTLIYLTQQVSSRFSAIFTALGKIKTTNNLIKLQTIAPLFILFPALFLIDSPGLLAILYYAGLFIFFLVGLKVFRAKETEKSLLINIDNTIKYEEIKNDVHFRFGLHQSIINLVNIVAAHSDKVIIFQLLGAQEAAIYYVATNIPNRMRVLAKDFSPWILSKYIHKTADAVRNQILVSTFLLILLIIPIYVLYIIFAPWLFRILLPQYLDAVFISQIYALTLFVAPIVISHTALKAHGNASDFYIMSIIYAFLRPILITIGALTFGLIGVVVACIIEQMTNMILVTYLAKKHRDV